MLEQLYKKGDSELKIPSNLATDNEYENTQLNTDQSNLLNKEITVHEVESAINSLKNGKSSSFDQISNEMIKLLPPAGIQALTRLFNNCLTEGVYP